VTYSESLDFLYSQLPMYQRIGAAAYKTDLKNIEALCDYIGNPHHSFKSIHIAGTNGKGSVSQLMTSVCIEGGLKVGTYTSPHYLDFRERIKINGDYIPQERVIKFVNTVLSKDILDEINPSFFEITVAMAFWYFSEEEVDIAIIETGLGGRLDSTNIITPILSVITNISFDHEKFLGSSLSSIAREKAGIIKQGIPVVIGETQKDVAQVFIETATSAASPLMFADQNYVCTALPLNSSELVRPIKISKHPSAKKGKNYNQENLVEVLSPLLADYQLKNIITAFASFQELKEALSLNKIHFMRGLEKMNENSPAIGRFQIMETKPTVIFDSSHNYAGLEATLKQVESLHYRELHIIYGTVNDKDVSSMISLFPEHARYYLTQPTIPRRMPVHELSTFFSDYEHMIFTEPETALASAHHYSGEQDVILVLGSIFLVADLLENS